jgi:RNA polymerase sigma factor (TIGR02999 family)
MSLPTRPIATYAMSTDIPKGQAPLERAELPPAEELLPLVYQELRRLAAHKMAHEAPGQTLQPTALVHEAWLRLGADGQPPWRNRAHFFAAAAEAMRQILVERARRHNALKRAGGASRVSLDEVEIPIEAADDERLLAVDEALEQFAARDPRKAELVKLRYFIGMSFEEAASVLGIAVPTAKKWWAYSRAWLAVSLRHSNEVGGPLSPSPVQAGLGGEKNV